MTIPLNLTEKNQIRKLAYTLSQNAEKVGKSINTDEEETEKKIKEIVRKNFELHQAETMISLFQKREWEREGKAWSFYYKNFQNAQEEYGEDKGTKGEIVVQTTENAIALLDCRYGYLYYWDNELCAFCLINMVNFLLQERWHMESPDKHCERNLPNVKIYYKGILLEERELPGIGNELLQYIDIKGKLEREYVSLSRRGFTEKGKEYFLQKIYTPLLESVLKTLKVMNKEHSNDVIRCVEKSLKDKSEVLNMLNAKMTRWKNGEEQIEGAADQNQWMERFLEKRNQILIMFKETAISITMLAFFAQKEIFEPLVEISGGYRKDGSNCWAESIEIVRKYCRKRKRTDGSGMERIEGIDDRMLDDSVLFHIEPRPRVDLDEELGQEVRESDYITFPDIFSQKNQFMVISKRENRLASWKQYLIPIWSLDDKEVKQSIIQCLEKYSIIESGSAEKKRMEVRILRMGMRALALAGTYGTDSFGGSGAMNPDEYLQQYFLKWLLRYIPTVALFMSEDGNTRVNIIHGKTFPFVFMDMATKKLILHRILEEAEKYDIQRFSIPAWQGLEYLSCKKLPYSHYFVKRGYMAEESYSKVIFPFAKDELDEIVELIYSDRTQETIHRLRMLKKLLNVRQQLISILPESEPKVQRLLASVQDDDKKQNILNAYNIFREYFQQGSSKARRVFEKVRTEYRNFVVQMLGQKEWKTEFSWDNLDEISKDWNEVYLWLMLRTLNSDSNRAEDYKEEFELEIEEEKKESLGRVWYYILTKEYLQNGRNVLEYEKEYKEAIDKETGVSYEKRERILAYIERARGSVLQREYLQNYWMRYVAEIFELFQSMEERQYQIMDGQADWEVIKNEMSRREREKTKDADK